LDQVKFSLSLQFSGKLQYFLALLLPNQHSADYPKKLKIDFLFNTSFKSVLNPCYVWSIFLNLFLFLILIFITRKKKRNDCI
jgi:hypothetical protein